MRSLIQPFLLLFLLKQTHQRVNIWEPKSLKSIYTHAPFEYSVMDFGSVPYGHSVYGTLFKASPYDACSELQPIPWDNNYGTLIILTERGQCNFSTKVINAQKIGAGLVLIADNSAEDVHRIFPIERAKERLDSVNIPAILVSKQEAEDIGRALEAPTNRPHDRPGSPVELAVTFELTRSNGKSDLKIIVAVDDFRSYDLLLGFNKYADLFSRHINYQIHFKLFYNSNRFFGPDDCIGSSEHHYCVGKSFGNTKKGLDLPLESLRQLCIKNFSYHKYIKYIRQVRGKCFGKDDMVVDDFKNCTQKIYENVINGESRLYLNDCINPDSESAKAALKKNHDKIKYYLINYSPIIFINGSYYKGNYDNQSHLIESFCNSFEDPPAECNFLGLFQQSYYLNTHVLYDFIFYSSSSCAFFAFVTIVVFYFLYKRKIQRMFKFTLDDRINEALSKYYEERDTAIRDDESEKEKFKSEIEIDTIDENEDS